MLIDDLKSRFPDLDSSIIDKYFPIYENTYQVYYNAVYGSNAIDNEIILNLLAHLILSSDKTKDGSNVKKVASENVGSVSVSYATNLSNTNDTFFNSTIYGQQYLLLINRNKGTYFV